jgi:hypothetical protein
VILHEVPSAATRRVLVERGDVQASFASPDRDAADGAFDALRRTASPASACTAQLRALPGPRRAQRGRLGAALRGDLPDRLFNASACVNDRVHETDATLYVPMDAPAHPDAGALPAAPPKPPVAAAE